MQVTRFEPALASAAELDECIQVQLAASQADRPDEPAAAPQALLARLTRTPYPGRRYFHWLARPAAGGPGAAAGFLNLSGDQPAGLAAIDITVHPDYRRRGLATTLLREIAAAAAAGRDCLLIEGLIEGSAGAAWAQILGFEVVQRTVGLSLNLTAADTGRWPVRAPAGYRLEMWTGSVPDSLLISYAAARNAIREAPHGGLSFAEPEWTPERVRDEEATAVARDCELRAAVAITEDTGQVAGLTYLEVYQARPDIAVQQDTAVLAGHRGHRLGVWLKAANLIRLTADHPAVARVTTSNAAENEHMLRVNQALGFGTAARTEIREALLPELTARLAR